MFNRTKHDNITSIIESNLDYLVRFAFFRLGNRMEAEDIVHDAILIFLEKDCSKLKSESLRLYLFRIVHNLCIDMMRTRTTNLNLTENLEIEYMTEDLLDIEEADRINTCIASLPEQESEIIRMRVVDNLSFSDIGQILSVPQSTVKSRFKSGLDKLRKLVINFKMP